MENDQPGNQSHEPDPAAEVPRTWRSGGFTFDMGPSWHLIPEVFEGFFEWLGTSRERVFEGFEQGGRQRRRYLGDVAWKYQTAMRSFLF